MKNNYLNEPLSDEEITKIGEKINQFIDDNPGFASKNFGMKMPLRFKIGSRTRYYLIAFNKIGNEADIVGYARLKDYAEFKTIVSVEAVFY